MFSHPLGLDQGREHLIDDVRSGITGRVGALLWDAPEATTEETADKEVDDAEDAA